MESNDTKIDIGKKLSFGIVLGDLARKGYGRYKTTAEYRTPDGKVTLPSNTEFAVSNLSLGYVAIGEWGKSDYTNIAVCELDKIDIE